MYPSKPADIATGTSRSRRRRLRGPLILAATASLFGASAIATTASGATNGSSATHQAATAEATAKHAKRFARAETAQVTGAATDGTAFQHGKFTLQRFVAQNGTMFAAGTLKGVLNGQSVTQQVMLPVEGASNAVGGQGIHGLASPAQATPGACSILTLDLGPLDLNLLGLHVFLDEVHLLIEAIPGAGNLLGNLLCAVAGLLDGGQLGQLTALLNSITSLLNSILAF